MQMIVPHVSVPLVVTDLEHLLESQQEAEMLQLANAEVQRPIDLSQEPQLRAMLFRLEAEKYLLLLTIHHLYLRCAVKESLLLRIVSSGNPTFRELLGRACAVIYIT